MLDNTTSGIIGNENNANNKGNVKYSSTATPLMNPQVDFVFKNIFANEKHPRILISLLNAIFGYDENSPQRIVAVKIENPNATPERMGEKYAIFDIRATTNLGEIINIEMQRHNKYNTVERSLYNLSRIFSGHLQEGEDYKTVQRCVVISIVNFKLFDDDLMHQKFSFYNNKTKRKLTDLVELHYVELPKLKRQEVDYLRDLLYIWFSFITNPESEVIEMAKNKVDEVAEAVSILETLSQNKEARQIYELRRRALHDEVSSMAGARNEGKEEGIQEGIEIGMEKGMEKGMDKGMEKGIQLVAANMKKTKMDIQQISSITGLSIDEIEKL